MRPAGALAILVLSLACLGQAPAPAVATQKPSLNRDEIAKIESGFEVKLRRLNDQNPPSVLGACSGIYLRGYGVVFTTALDLTTPPRGSPFEPMPAAGMVHERRLANLPLLKQTMRDMLAGAAKGLAALPANEKIVVAVRLLYMQGDDKTGLPSQIVAAADRASALAGAFQPEEQ
jgi:hypothetical protein